MVKRNLITLLTCFLFSSGCFEYEESTSINNDGSGLMNIKYSIQEKLADGNPTQEGGIPPGMFNEDSLKLDFESASGVKVNSIKSYVENEMKFMEIIVKFDSFESFSQSDMSGGGFIGQMSLTDNGDGNLLFEREVCIGICDEEEEENPNKEGMVRMLASFNWNYTVKFPTKIISANTNIDEKNNSASWNFNMGSVLEENQVMQATFVNPEPNDGKTSNLGPILILLLVLGGGAFVVMNSKKNE